MTEQKYLHELIESSTDAHRRMSKAGSIAEATEFFSQAQQILQEAIALAEKRRNAGKVVWLEHRLAHITGIYRSQISSMNREGCRSVQAMLGCVDVPSNSV